MNNKKIIFGATLVVLMMLMTSLITNTQAEIQRKENNQFHFHILFIRLYQYEDDGTSIPFSCWVNGRPTFELLYWAGLAIGESYFLKCVYTNEVTIRIRGYPYQWTEPFSQNFDLSECGTFVRFKATAWDDAIEIL